MTHKLNSHKFSYCNTAVPELQITTKYGNRVTCGNQETTTSHDIGWLDFNGTFNTD